MLVRAFLATSSGVCILKADFRNMAVTLQGEQPAAQIRIAVQLACSVELFIVFRVILH